jgi:hypothetical protein
VARSRYLQCTKTAVEVEAEVEYELDQEDEQWIAEINASVRAEGGGGGRGGGAAAAARAPLQEQDVEVLIDRFEKADAKLHKLLGHSAACVLAMRCVGVAALSTASLRLPSRTPRPTSSCRVRLPLVVAAWVVVVRSRTEVAFASTQQTEVHALPEGGGAAAVEAVHRWWVSKRERAGQQLLRRFRPPPDRDDADFSKPFRRCSPFGKGVAAAAAAAAADGQASGAGRDGQAAEQVAAQTHSVGDIVEANWNGRGVYYCGIIAAVNPDGTFAIKYHDGDCEDHMPAHAIRSMGRRRRAPPPRQMIVNFWQQQLHAAAAGGDHQLPPHHQHPDRSASEGEEGGGGRGAGGDASGRAAGRAACAAAAPSDPDRIGAEEACTLTAGTRVLFKWHEPGGRDHGLWFAATVGQKCGADPAQGWFALDFDQFDVTNARSWNLQHHARRGALRRASSVAAHRLRRAGGGAPVSQTVSWLSRRGPVDRRMPAVVAPTATR